MKINPKSEKGAITLVVLVAMLFLTAFLMSMYITIANKAQTSAETTKQIAEKYNNIDEANIIYNSYFSDSDVIPIYTREHLEKIGSGEHVTINGKVYIFSSNAYYTLQNDLDFGGYYDETTGNWTALAGNEWTPLPDTFTGILDGLGNTITGLYINDTTASNQGLFGTLEGTVKNLKILDSYISANEYVGAIAGLNEGTIENCHNKATVKGTNYVGGIAGNLSNDIVNCYNTGNIIANKNVTGGYFKSITTGEIIDVWSDSTLEENAYFVSGNYIATAPKGFKVSKNVFEQTIEDGMVIQDTKENEFVWVPVENAIVTQSKILEIKANDNTITSDLLAVQKLVNTGIYPMAVEVTETKGDGEAVTNYKGILYAFEGTDELKLTVYDWKISDTNLTSYREPATLRSKNTWSAETIVNGTTIPAGTSYVYDSQNMFTLYGLGTYSDALYQNEYNSMVKKVDENKGFYVGRYEISLYIDSQNNTIKYAQSKKGETALDTACWFEMYKYQRDYASYNTGLGVTSEMIWGSQWDQMLIFINGKYDGATLSGDVNIKTGMNKKDQVANIFDLAGSRREWTQEANWTYYRVTRSGYYKGGDDLKYRGPGFPCSIYKGQFASRTTLYIK